MLLRKFRHGIKSNISLIQRSLATALNDDGSKEFKIPVPWGHIAGKEWGPPNGKKVLAVHGWLDNIGTFDTLIPLLDPSLHIYAFDLPGHGKSSPYLHKIPDLLFDSLAILNRVLKYISPEEISCLGHSLGASLGYLYSAIFPEAFSNLVALDQLKPFIRRDLFDLPEMEKEIESRIELDKKLASLAPSYSYEEAIQKRIKASLNSVTSETAKILCKRDLLRNSTGDQYSFTIDQKMKIQAVYFGITLDNFESYAHKITCPVLLIKFDSGGLSAPLSYMKPEMETLKRRPAPFFYKEVKGLTHHGHLNHPERVAPLINEFLALS